MAQLRESALKNPEGLGAALGPNIWLLSDAPMGGPDKHAKTAINLNTAEPAQRGPVPRSERLRRARQAERGDDRQARGDDARDGTSRPLLVPGEKIRGKSAAQQLLQC